MDAILVILPGHFACFPACILPNCIHLLTVLLYTACYRATADIHQNVGMGTGFDRQAGAGNRQLFDAYVNILTLRG
jgi:hypothetical protein